MADGIRFSLGSTESRPTRLGAEFYGISVQYVEFEVVASNFIFVRKFMLDSVCPTP